MTCFSVQNLNARMTCFFGTDGVSNLVLLIFLVGKEEPQKKNFTNRNIYIIINTLKPSMLPKPYASSSVGRRVEMSCHD